MSWDTWNSLLWLLKHNQNWVQRKFIPTITSKNFSKRMWERLLGLLNSAAEMIPLGRLFHRHLMTEGNRVLSYQGNQDKLVPFPSLLCPLLHQWLCPGRLSVPVPWIRPDPNLFVMMDASYLCWGYQQRTRAGNMIPSPSLSSHKCKRTVGSLVFPSTVSVCSKHNSMFSNGQPQGSVLYCSPGII